MNSTKNEILTQGYKMRELGSLPEEWEVVRLGDYCNIFSGYAFKSDDFCNNGVLVVKIGNLQNGSIVLNDKESYFPRDKINNYISKFILNEGDILMALTGATTGKISVVPKSVDGALLNQRVGKFNIYNSSLFRSFAKYYFMSDEFQDTIKKNILQSAQGNISPKQIENFALPLPPLSEQQKIAAVLSAVQEAKEKTQAVIDATKALKKSMMKHLFTYGPVPLEETENVPLKETEIGKVPEDWEVVRLGEVAEITSGGTPSRKRNEYWINGNIPWIKSEQCHDCYISVANEYITDLGLKYSSAKMLKKGTVLLAMVGATIGKTGFLTFEACTNQNIAGMFPLKGLDNLFLYFALQSRYNEFYKIKGYAIANLSYLRQFSLPLPPLPIQQKIASILSAIDAKIEAEENKKKALEELFKTLLHNLMTAKIRVNHLEINV